MELTLRLLATITLALIPTLCSACLDAPQRGDGAALPTGPGRAILELEVRAPLADAVCARFTFGSAAGPATEPTCDATTEGRALLSAEEACPEGASSLRVIVADVAAMSDPSHGSGAWADPCGRTGCALEVPCDGATTRARFDLANERTFMDWVATTVALPDLFLGAKATTCRDGEPLALLQDADGAPRRATAALAFGAAILAPTAAPGDPAAPELAFATPAITCAGGVRCELPATAHGVPLTATCSDGHTVDYHLYAGVVPDTVDTLELYANLAVDLQDLQDAGQGDCALAHAATATVAPLDLDPRDAYPVVRWSLPLLDHVGAIDCHDVTFDDYGHEDASVLGLTHLLGDAIDRMDGERRSPAPCHRWDGAHLTSTCP